YEKPDYFYREKHIKQKNKSCVGKRALGTTPAALHFSRFYSSTDVATGQF
ncbi:hypothetical protein ACJX0J_020778, partial [Zea mays]